ncbi:MAG: Fe-S cluster assembly protein SufD [Myxococcota bacterium]
MTEQQYAELARGLSEGPPGWVELRQGAADALVASGFPGPRDEAWKYTRPAALLDHDWAPAEGDPPEVDAEADPEADVVLVDGRLLRARAAPGTTVESIRQDSFGVGHILGEDPAGFLALNLALARDGVAVRVPAGVSAKLVVQHVATGGERLGAARHLINVDPGGELLLVERFTGQGPAFTSAVVEAHVSERASLVHVREQAEGPGVPHHGVVGVNVGAGGRYHAVSVLGGAGTTRVELRVALQAPGAHVSLDGLVLVAGREHADHHVRIEHRAPGCTSRQAFRSLCAGRSRSVFTGNVVVAEGAVGTDAAQVHRALLLSDDAVADARPQLEISCDDVRCTHGAAVGALDAEALFYLRQRGLGELAARSLLTEAFAAEIVDALPDEALRDALRARVAGWLGAAS